MNSGREGRSTVAAPARAEKPNLQPSRLFPVIFSALPLPEIPFALTLVLMKTLRISGLLAALTLAIFAVGCATPENRIRKNPEAFARLSSEQQSLIMQGKIAIGFDKEMVQLALGEPDRLITRTTENGVSEIWSYTTYQSDSGVFLYRGWYHRYYSYRDPLFPYYLDVPSRRDRERFRVVFRADRVVEIQQET